MTGPATEPRITLAPRAKSRRSWSIFLRVLVAVVTAGAVTVALSTAAVIRVVGDDREAELVDGVIDDTEAMRDRLDSRVELARAQLSSVALAAEDGHLFEVPELVSREITAVRAVRGDTELVEAGADERALEIIREVERPEPGTVRMTGDGHFVIAVHTAGIDAYGLLDAHSVLSAPAAWLVTLHPSGELDTARWSEEDILAQHGGGVVVRREISQDDEIVRAFAPTRSGPVISAEVSLAPARASAFATTRRVAAWSLASLLPLVLLAWFLARRLTNPVRALASAVRSSGNDPVRRPGEVGGDEIGELAGAIVSMSERLHADARTLRASLGFYRRIAKARSTKAVLEELEKTLRENLPGCRWTVVDADAIEDSRLPEGLTLDAEVLRATLDSVDPEEPDLEDDPLRNTGSFTSIRATSHADLPDGTVLVALVQPGFRHGVVIGEGAKDEDVVRKGELLCRAATSALQNQRLLQGAAINDKLAALGRLSASVAHEMNNPLAFVLANLRMLEEELDGELRSTAEDAREGAERLAAIVQDLSSISRDRSRTPTVDRVEIGTLVEAVVKMSAARRPEVKVEVLESETVAAIANRGRVQQAVLNLLVNAIDAAASGSSRPAVEVRVVRTSGEVVIEVRDNGPGIPNSVQRKIFDAFFSTKGEGGTGLGLYLSRNFMQAYGGDIKLVQTGVEGTTFWLTLPAVTSQVSRRLSSTPATPGKKKRVLIVDDEEAIVRGFVRWLGERADVRGTSDPEEALRAISSEDFSLILCDLNMPTMSGLDFLATVRERVPRLADRVVIMTGSTSTVPDGVRVLRKPIRPEVMERLIAEAG